jgi:hypothetical protein
MEVRKLTSLRLTRALGLAALAASVLITLGYAWLVGQIAPESPVSAEEATMATVGRPGPVAVAVALLGVLAVTADRRGAGLAVTATIEPLRAVGVLAKAAAAALCGCVLAVVGLALDTAAALAMLGPEGLVTGAGDWARVVLGALAVALAWAAIGVAVGFLVPAAAPAALLVVLGPWLAGRAVALLATTGVPGPVVDLVVAVDPFRAAADLRGPLQVADPVILGAVEHAPASAAAAAAVLAVFVVALLASAAARHSRTDLSVT